MQEVLHLPARASTTDNATIQNAVAKYGAVATYMFRDSGRCDSSTKGFYGTSSSTDHAVDIVGWDDNYALTNFSSPQPPANGAFVIRHSWGSGRGAAGCLWIPYYDASVGGSLTVPP